MKFFTGGLTLVVVLPFLISTSAFPETENHSLGTQNGTTSAESGTKGNHPTQAAPLTDRERKFISDNFFISELTVHNKYSEKLPLALEIAMKAGSEKESSEIVAQLMGMLNKQQAEQALENAKKEKDSEVSKKPNGGDDRFIALTERIVWGAKLFLKTPSKEESAEKYNKEFEVAFKDVEAKNAEILEKVKQAADGNDQAKEWLRKNLDQSSLLSFVEGQKKFGNGQLADRILDAVSFKDGKNKFLDMSLQNETQRLHLGQTAKSVSTSFDKFLENRKGFKGAVVSFAPHENSPMKQWFVDDKGSFKSGAPTYSSPSVSNGPNSQTNNGSTITTKPGLPTGGSSSTVSVNPSGAYAKILSTCNKCHSGDVSIDSNGTLIKDGSPRSKSEILSAFREVRQMAQPSGKLTAEERTAVMALVSQWLK